MSPYSTHTHYSSNHLDNQHTYVTRHPAGVMFLDVVSTSVLELLRQLLFQYNATDPNNTTNFNHWFEGRRQRNWHVMWFLLWDSQTDIWPEENISKEDKEVCENRMIIFSSMQKHQIDIEHRYHFHFNEGNIGGTNGLSSPTLCLTYVTAPKQVQYDSTSKPCAVAALIGKNAVLTLYMWCMPLNVTDWLL